MNAETPVQTPGNLYEQSKISRNGITLFKRYPAPRDDYYFRFSAGGRRITRKLVRTAEESFKLARRLMDETAAGRFAAVDGTKARTVQVATIGEIFHRYKDRARSTSGVQPRTVAVSVNTLKVILREVKGLRDDQIETLSSSVLERGLLEDYKAKMLARAGDDRIRERAVRTTCNSTMRQARSLFAKKLGPEFYSGLVLPPRLQSFLDVQFFPVEIVRFRMPASDLLEKVRAYAALLKKTDLESYKIYLLSLGAGLRKGEISHARLRWLETRDAGKVIRIQTEPDFRIKDNDERVVPLDSFVAAELAEILVNHSQDDYLLTGSMTERTDCVFRRFSTWLKSMGWGRRKKCHEMRKVFGSMVTSQAGVRAAQVLLGHASVSTTENTYVDPAAGYASVTIFQPAKVA